MKYVVLEHDMGAISQKVPVIFPDYLIHRDVADHIAALLRNTHGFENVRAVSAGEINMVNCRCFGRSSTLELEADPGDSDLILAYDYTGGLA